MTRSQLKPKNPSNQYLRDYAEAVRKGLESQHVLPHADGWAVKKIEANKASRVFANKKDAIKHAEKVAANQKSGVVVHKKDGRVAAKKAYQK